MDRRDQGRRVLIVDDEPDARESMKLLLERAGYEVRVASDGAAALSEQPGFRAELLITDLFMPEIDGFETIDRFRREYPEVRIIAVSGWSQLAPGDKYLFAAGVAGANAVLSKPVQFATLRRTLDEVMRA